MSPDEQNKTPNLADFELVEPKDGAPAIYCNIANLSWTGMDLTAQLYQFIQPNRDFPKEAGKPNQLVHRASVTLAWTSAKLFHKLLGEVLARYEKANGQISTEFKPI